MKKQADAVIIGGGIIGASVAFYLAKAKFGSILLLEKEDVLGSGATAKAAGGIRAQFSTKVNIQMSMLSETIFERFEDETGYDALFDQVGYLFLVNNAQDAATFTEHAKLQRSLGLDTQLLKPSEIRELAPHVRTDDIHLGTFCKQDGLGDPYEFMSGYAEAARRLGVEIALKTPATGIAKAADKITGVKTSAGEISTPLVINCSGPFSKLIGDMIGRRIPIEPLRRQVVTTTPLDFVQSFFPMVVDVTSGLYSHKESSGLLLGWADKDAKPSFDISIDPEYTDNILERALDRMPQLETAEIASVWAGLYETTPDHHSIIGWEPELEGFFHVAGFSGHGFMHAPAAGIVTAEILTGKEPSIDISPLSPERFVSGKIIEETNVI